MEQIRLLLAAFTLGGAVEPTSGHCLLSTVTGACTAMESRWDKTTFWGITARKMSVDLSQNPNKQRRRERERSTFPSAIVLKYVKLFF